MTIKPIINNSYFDKCWKYNLNIIRYQSTFPLILPGLTDDNQMNVIEWTDSLNDIKTLTNRSKCVCNILLNYNKIISLYI